MDAWKDVVTSDQRAVYLGQWTNWSRGPVLGATLTLTKRDGNLVIAFAAFFVTLVASRTWRLICLCCHQVYSRDAPRDAPYHQRQVILRNSSSPQAAVWRLVQLGHSWFSNESIAKQIRRTVLPVLLALSCIAGFAGVTYVLPLLSVSSGDEVLLRPGECGWLNASEAYYNITEFWTLTSPLLATQVTNAANYAQQCYSTDSTGTLDCNGFVENRIASTVQLDAPCPFDESMCRSTSNIFLDTGYLDSHRHFGMNGPEDERVLYRGTLQCAPLVTEGYTTTVKSTTGNFTQYHHGYFRADATKQLIADGIYMVPDLETQYNVGGIRNNSYPLPSSNYKIDVFPAEIVNGSVTDYCEYIPLPKLQRNDGDPSIVFLSGNGVHFVDRSEDDWYRATRPWLEVARTTDPSMTKTFIFNEAASPLGCVEQFQFCQRALPEGQQCSALGSWLDASAAALDMSPSDAAALRLNWVRSQAARLNTVLNTLQARALTTQRTLSTGVQGPILADQWQSDVLSWWAIMLANMQSNFLDSVVGPADKRLDKYISAPEGSTICANQNIRSTAYMSFNVFGLYTLFLGGALLIALSFSIEPILSCLYRRRRYNQYKYLEWVSNESLQLHRLAHEGVGWGTWSRATEDIPVTKKDEVLGCLDLAQPLHPRLCSVSSGSECEEIEPGYMIADYTPEPLATTTPGVAQTTEQMQGDDMHEGTDSDSLRSIQQQDASEAQYHPWMTQNPEHARFPSDGGGFPRLPAHLPAHWPQGASVSREAGSLVERDTQADS